MAIFREVILRLDPFQQDVVYERIPVVKYNAFIERVYTRKSEYESATPVAIIRDTGVPTPMPTIEGMKWDTEYFLTLVCVRKRGPDTELPDDAGRLLGVVNDPTHAWYLCAQRTPRPEPRPEPPPETVAEPARASPEYS